MKSENNGEEIVNRVVAKVLNLDEGAIRDDMSPENTEGWDSFNGLMILSEIEKGTNLSFDIDDILKVKTVGDIKQVVSKYFKNGD